MTELEDAAFHAWFTLGELLVPATRTRFTRIEREEIESAYIALGNALARKEEKTC